MKTYAAFSEYPESESEFKESPDGIYTREWNTTNHEDPLWHITLSQDRTALVLTAGLYRLTGFSSLAMMPGVYPVIDTVNAYPGCCYVYDAARWPVLPGPRDDDFGEFMQTCSPSAALPWRCIRGLACSSASLPFAANPRRCRSPISAATCRPAP